MVRARYPVTPIAGGIRIAVHLQPRASTSSIVGRHGDSLKIRVAAPPVDQAANEALVQLLAEVLQRPRSSVDLIAGASSRRKVIVVMGIGVQDASRRLGLGAGPAGD